MNNLVSTNGIATSAMLAADAAIFFIAFFGGTYITWWAVGILKWDKIVHDPYGPQARMLRFMLALLGGFLTGLIAVFYLVAGQALRLLL